MPIPLIVYVAVGAGGAIYYYQKNPDGVVAEISKDAADAAVEAGADVVNTTLEGLLPILENAAEAVGDAFVDVAKYIGPALIEGIGNTYEAARSVLRGKEDDVIAGFTVGFLAILTIVFLYNSAKKGGA
jgi:putative N-acetylmannosamine-6-phosphate epimerase|tara:strand:+ start:335 stop:721 length:387 start_codon:yes stop_codon:yes gene_type:complete